MAALVDVIVTHTEKQDRTNLLEGHLLSSVRVSRLCLLRQKLLARISHISAVFQTINEQKPSRKTEGWAIFGQHLEGIHQTGTSRQKNSRGLPGKVIRGFKEIRNTTFRRAG